MNFKEQLQTGFKQYQNLLNEPRWVIISAIWMLWLTTLLVGWGYHFYRYEIFNQSSPSGSFFVIGSTAHGYASWIITTTFVTIFNPGILATAISAIATFVVFNLMKPR